MPLHAEKSGLCGLVSRAPKARSANAKIGGMGDELLITVTRQSECAILDSEAAM